MNYTELLAQDRRLAILMFLEGAAGRELNTFVLREFLARTGHNVSRDQVAGDAAWLAEQGLAEVEKVGPAGAQVTVVRLTARGSDVATGRAVVPGVKRPEA